MSVYTRRDMLKRSAQTAAGLAAAGALSPRGLVTSALASPPTLSPKAGGLASAATLRKWTDYLARLGPRYTATAAHQQYINDLQAAMAQLGWETDRKTQSFSHWNTDDFGLKVRNQGHRVGHIRASAYYPYSGETPAGGLTGELKFANKGAPADYEGGEFAGKIAVVEASLSPAPLGALFKPWFAYPAEVNPSEPYARSFGTVIPPLSAAKAAGCIGVVIILPLVPADAAGQYFPIKQPIQGIPALHVDVIEGKEVRELSKTSGNVATLSLPATVTPDTTDALLAVLPGSNPEDVVVVNTHSDGPNMIEENGGLGMLSVAQHLAGKPIAERPSTIAFYFATGHFASGCVASARYVTDYPSLFEKTKAGVTFEHLGCPEYVDDHVSSYGPTGKPEPSAAYCSNEKVATIAEAALQGAGVSRSAAYKPPFLIGEGIPLNAAGIPMMSYIVGPDYLLAASGRPTQHRRFDLGRMQIEINALSTMIDQAAATPRSSLK
jgi:hypothetical protein